MSLATEGLVKIYGKRKVVDSVSLKVEKGQVIGLLGPNGAGKTTTFYMIVGMIGPDYGSIILEDEDITPLPMYRRAQKGVGYLPQEVSVFQKLTVQQNIMAILETMDIPKGERKKKASFLMDELGISKLARNRASTLSGGERRRVEITRTLAIEPKFMLLDEPFAGLDPITVEDIQNIVLRLKDKGLGVLITDHNVRGTLEITDYAYIMCEGEILIEGTAEFLANDAEAKKIYLGERFTLH